MIKPTTFRPPDRTKFRSPKGFEPTKRDSSIPNYINKKKTSIEPYSDPKMEPEFVRSTKNFLKE